MPHARTIAKESTAVLRKKTLEIPLADISSRTIQQLIKAMQETLARTPDGVGLAAPQVGESLRLFIVSEEAEEIDRTEATRKNEESESNTEPRELAYEKRPWQYYVFINPVVKRISRKKLKGPEGCLSVPGVFGPVERSEKITVEAYDEHGNKFTRGASGFFARVVQHELDHLDGVLFIDKAEKLIRPSKSPV